MTHIDPARLGPVFAENQRYLWGLCYRMTGVASDADDLVQETFVRALAKPPSDTRRPWRPWLTRVAMNLCRDHLRRRRRISYDGPWLPAPIETDPLEDFVREEERAYEPACTQGRYELLESVSLAFLIALEALTPAQRAVLLLCDVFGYTGLESAQALEMSHSNVRQTLRRARRTMEAYDRTRIPNTDEYRDEMLALLPKLMVCMAQRDVDGVEKLLADDVFMANDANGEFYAARVPVVGRNKVARFQVNITPETLPRFEIRILNGLPAVVVQFDEAQPGIAPRFVSAGWLNRDGRITRIHLILATSKLSAIRPLSAS